MDLYYLIYISTSAHLLEQEELTDILKKSRDNNAANDVTGVLLYSQGTFIQALEGLEKNVLEVYKDIKLDTRHKNIITIIEGPLEDRVFPGWKMAFATFEPAKLMELEGYINPASESFIKSDSNHPAITILKTFAESNNLSGIFLNGVL
jgi:hypothetical protein